MEYYNDPSVSMLVIIDPRMEKSIKSGPCTLKISCQSPECGFDDWPPGSYNISLLFWNKQEDADALLKQTTTN